MRIKYFFDVPVYRISPERYKRDMAIYLEDGMYGKSPNIDYQLKAFHEREPSMKRQFECHLINQYGGSWVYNEIIGWIQLHFLGTQIRGEYWAVDAKRITRTRKKIFEFKSWKLVPEHDVPDTATNTEIFGIIQNYLVECQKELKHRYIDTSRLELIGRYVDWRLLIGDDESA